MNAIDKTVADFLESQNIKFDIYYLSYISLDDNKWEYDLWQYTFSKQGAMFTEQFKTGIGLRQLNKKVFKHSNFDHLHPTRKKKWTEENSIPVAPTAAIVLYCAILDASALDTSFDYWCVDYGYDADSISHFNVYQQCCKIGKEIRKVFTKSQIDQLQEMLQDY